MCRWCRSRPIHSPTLPNLPDSSSLLHRQTKPALPEQQPNDPHKPDPEALPPDLQKWLDLNA